jgi:hypothetical protein
MYRLIGEQRRCHLKTDLQQDILKYDFFKCVEIRQG